MAMNTLFENTTNLNDSVIDHVIEITFMKNKKRNRHHIALLIVGLLGGAVAIYYGYYGIKNHNTTTILTSIALIVFAVYCMIYYFSYNTKKEIKAYRDTYGQGLKKTRHIRVYKDRIDQSAGKAVADYEISNITAIETYEHYYMLKYGNGYILIDRDGFTKGTPEEFEAHIRQRMMVV